LSFSAWRNCLGKLSCSGEFLLGCPSCQAITYEWWLLENPVGRYLGRISYSVYLWGMVAIAIVERMGHDWLHLPVFAVVIVIGSVSHFLIERPFQSLGKKWSRPREPIPSTPAYETLSNPGL
jgi:peptidoglycan/LPS O-acetylase OafA/YrhL